MRCRRGPGVLVLTLACAACTGAKTGEGAQGKNEAPPPAAGMFVYECTDEGREDEDLCLVPVGGGPERRLTKGPATDLSPRFTADGKRVLFSSNRDGEFALFVVGVDGRGLVRVRAGTAREWQSDPSRDGRRIVFLSNAEGVQSVRTSSWSGADERELVRRKGRVILGNAHFSPDGEWVVYSSNEGNIGHHVYVVEVRTGAVRRISSLVSGACEPRFSPDGKRVVHVRRNHLMPQHSEIIEHILSTGVERVLVDWPALNYDPVYSPDQKEIAFASIVGGRYALYRMRLSDGRAWRVTSGALARHPDYQPQVQRSE